jgi:hypothetical protein
MLPRVSLAFFMFAALCGLTGMGWGIFMGISQDHSTFSAHAHLNLLGWVSLSLMGGFYALAKDRMGGTLPWINLSLSVFGLVTMIPSLAGKLSGQHAAWIDGGIAIGSLACFAGMATFVTAVAMTLLRSSAPAKA